MMKIINFLKDHQISILQIVCALLFVYVVWTLLTPDEVSEEMIELRVAKEKLQNELIMQRQVSDSLFREVQLMKSTINTEEDVKAIKEKHKPTISGIKYISDDSLVKFLGPRVSKDSPSR